MGALKLGLAAGLAYTLGGKAGTTALRYVKPDASADAVVGAAWGGRIATFFLGVAVLGRI